MDDRCKAPCNLSTMHTARQNSCTPNSISSCTDARQGRGCCLVGALGIAPEKILETVGADAKAERFMGAIWYGFPKKPLSLDAVPPKRKQGLASVLRQLP